MSEHRAYKGSGLSPRLRSASGILSDLSTTACPLDKPIRFATPKLRRGTIERTASGRKFKGVDKVVTYTNKGERRVHAPRQQVKLVTFMGETYAIPVNIAG